MGNDLITQMATDQGMDRVAYWNTLKNTVIPGGTSNEHITAFLAVANQYGLNPMTKEIYAFPSKGGVTPIVSVDGWLKLANKHPQFDGLTTEEVREGGAILAVTCTVYRKDRSHPVMATEYMAECKRPTEPWKQWPVRMLTNKAMIQAIRRAFSFAGIYDPDEGERIHEAEYTVVDNDMNVHAKEATDDKTSDLKEKLKREQSKATGAGEQGESPDSPQSPQESSPAPSPEDNDLMLLEWDALVALAQEKATTANDKKLLASAIEKKNQSLLVKLVERMGRPE